MKDVTDLVAERVEHDATLAEEAKLLVLAALEGDAALADMAGFTPRLRVIDTDESPAEPAGAFLQQIRVRGFRGIGPDTQLTLTPGPGLTVVAGRNGSGKSSFSEALEVALTKQTYRWQEKRSNQWRNAWRNLHHPDPRIEITLAEEAVGATKITVGWPDGTDKVDQMNVALQRPGQKQTDLADLGWTRDLENFRPILSYDELGALLTSEPSRLYDALARVLGLDQIADAIKALDAHRKELSQPESEVRTSKKELTAQLAQLDDPRADRANALITAKNPDPEAVRALAAGGDQHDDGAQDQLTALLRLGVPDAGQVSTATEQLEHTITRMAAEGDLLSETIELRAAVLEAAIELHDHQGAQRCPVCDEGRLDDARADQLSGQVKEANTRLLSLRRARADLQEARAVARALVASIPAELGRPLPDDLEPIRVRALDAWTTWARLPDDGADDRALVTHLRQHHAELVAALGALQQAVRAVLARRADTWRPVAGRLALHADTLDRWESLRPAANATKEALDWLKQTDATLKAERIRPISEQVAEIWAALRQESNVEIAGITLAGASTRRRVEISSLVDGDDSGGGLALLSQGELHALALAMFLPRATMPESPFRFVVLDDPVQAMDPAKVDGLVTVLARIAQHRQLVVFSHDDRLASAVRRAAVNATILEVSRETESRVKINTATDPARRYLDDALALASDTKLPEETQRRILPGLLRLAVEAKARDRYFASQLSDGRTHAEVEARWNAAHRTHPRVALAIYGDDQDLQGWRSKAGHRAVALGVCSRGFHRGLTGDPKQICRDVEKTVRDIGDGAR